MFDNLTKTQSLLVGTGAGLFGLWAACQASITVRDKVTDYITPDNGEYDYSNGALTFESTPTEVTSV